MARDLTAEPPAPRRWHARLALIGVVVVLAHVWVAQRVAAGIAAFDPDGGMPQRMEVAYVKQMALSDPPPSAAPAAPDAGAPAVAARAAAVAAAAASAAAAEKAAKAKAADEQAARKAAGRQAAADAARRARAEAAAAAAAAAASAASAASEALASTGAAPASGEAGAGGTGAASMQAAASAPDTPASAALAGLPASAASAPVALAAASTPSTSASAVPLAIGAAGAASGAAGAAAFEWPRSTRMSYVLTGQFRGPVNGVGQVEWIRAGSRYQVHVDLLVGPTFAPLITRQMTSEGNITAAGLAPERYDQETKVVMRDRQHVTIRFEPDGITLANGEHRINSVGMQDTASQFVQLTYVFSTQPELLHIGNTINIPLALPHKTDIWTYDVVEQETLYTNFGQLPTIHIKPRRTGPPKVGELSAEIWFAPQLRYLPVRIRIQQDADNFVDMLIEKPPEMAAS